MTDAKNNPQSAPKERRLHRSDPKPPEKRDTRKDKPEEQPFLFTDWASI
ncbi:hypothetical protein O2N63_10390 [Aliiroseovarius sp. KMU-50]|uniref:Uncharacterized protein n=1 Tax=Aliiroseovarius salicola TaxID=3009082 RepID=A0ABT4W1V3_9RHOB|nr:hypothetical protein [Aliiroseovarius sp. KMU-50]MDA5094494.1 hypothetical protein [Aliiroseovarius sp. KMU-50]